MAELEEQPVAVANMAAETSTTGSKVSGLTPECEGLSLLANPVDEYARFDNSWKATGVATQAKYLESKFGLPVSPCPLILLRHCKGVYIKTVNNQCD